MMKKRYVVVLISALFISTSTPVLSETKLKDSSEITFSLREIMNKMDHDMQLISNAISREDWSLIEKLAPEIANHKQPKFNDTLLTLFKIYDDKAHQAAEDLKIAAADKNGYNVINKFSNLQTTCLICHQSFRKPYRDHLQTLE